MGYIRHQATIAIVWDDDVAAIAAIEALRGEMADRRPADSPADNVARDAPLNAPNCIVGPVKGINGYVSYAFLPDGSKDGWESSNVADKFRERFIQAAQKARFPNIATIQLGGDDGETRVLFTTDSVVAEPSL